MDKLTKEEAIAIEGAIGITLDLISEVTGKNSEIKESIKTLESAKNKIEKIYKEHD